MKRKIEIKIDWFEFWLPVWIAGWMFSLGIEAFALPDGFATMEWYKQLVTGIVSFVLWPIFLGHHFK